MDPPHDLRPGRAPATSCPVPRVCIFENDPARFRSLSGTRGAAFGVRKERLSLLALCLVVMVGVVLNSGWLGGIDSSRRMFQSLRICITLPASVTNSNSMGGPPDALWGNMTSLLRHTAMKSNDILDEHLKFGKGRQHNLVFFCGGTNSVHGYIVTVTILSRYSLSLIFCYTFLFCYTSLRGADLLVLRTRCPSL